MLGGAHYWIWVCLGFSGEVSVEEWFWFGFDADRKWGQLYDLTS